MGVLRLAVCVSGVYATFLLWAIAQERLVSVPFPSKHHPTRLQPTSRDNSHRGDKFPSPIFLTYAQAVASSLCAFIYLLFTSYRDGTFRYKGVSGITGWTAIMDSARNRRGRPLETPGLAYQAKMEKALTVDSGSAPTVGQTGHAQENMTAQNGAVKEKEAPESTHLQPGQKPFDALGKESVPWRRTLPGLVLQVAAFQTSAGPIGFLALEHISYPTMVLGKSCKLIPVLLLNVLIYRRKFSMHKYVVVGLVTIGISLFMLFGDKKKKGGSDSTWGLTLLLVNLLIDGMTNSTQDQIFATYRQFTGQQMMFVMAVLTQLLLLPFLLLPLPTHPLSLIQHLPSPLATHLSAQISGAPIEFSSPAFFESISFLISHPTAIKPLMAFACLGGLGQLFIFETIQHFGSLTLVMVTVTRKLFTMLLSVIVFEHVLNKGQWLGVAVVFLGIGVEAGIKRRDMLKRARRDKKQ